MVIFNIIINIVSFIIFGFCRTWTIHCTINIFHHVLFSTCS